MKCPCCGEEMVFQEKSWEAQLNAYRYLASKYGVAIGNLTIVAIFRDWSKREAGRNPDYPQSQVKVFDIPMWDFDTTELWLKMRIAAHEAAKANLPLCTDEDVWAKAPKWAAIRSGNKKASKLFDTYEQALRFVENTTGMEIEFRPGQHPRCEDYCSVSFACQQYQDWKKSNEETRLVLK